MYTYNHDTNLWLGFSMRWLPSPRSIWLGIQMHSGPRGADRTGSQQRPSRKEYYLSTTFKTSLTTLQDIFDTLGQFMASQMGERARSPASRADELSFFDEITPEQMKSYQPKQIKSIMQQRRNVSLRNRSMPLTQC